MPKNEPKEAVDECANSACEKPIFAGEKVWRKGFDRYCSGSCLAISMGAVKITAE